MRYFYILGFLLLFSVSCQASSTSKGIAKIGKYLTGNVNRIEKIIDLPDTLEFNYDQSVYVDIGVKFQSYEILFIPVWNSNIEYIGYINSDEEYLEIPKEKLEQIAHIKLPPKPKISFWYLYGGKLLFIMLVFTLIYALISRK